MVSSKKKTELENLKSLIQSHSSIGIVDIHKLPGAQMREIRETLLGKAVIRVTKKKVLQMALKDAGKEKLSDFMENEPALILSNDNAFGVYSFIQEKKSPSKPRPGDIASKDVVIPAGLTEMQAGPALTELKNFGLKVKVEGGKIAIMEDKKVLSAGDEIPAEMAGLINKFGIKPVEIGLNVRCFWSDGMIFGSTILSKSPKVYAEELNMAATHCFNLAYNSGYPIPETLKFNIISASMNAKALALNTGFFVGDLAEEFVKKGAREASALKGRLG